MAEGIAAGLAQTIITQLGSHALQEIGSALGVKKEVRRLHNTLTAIKDVLPHAENLQLSNNDVKSWLRRIKDAAYDAEDVIDDFATEALRKKLAMQGSIVKRKDGKLILLYLKGKLLEEIWREKKLSNYYWIRVGETIFLSFPYKEWAVLAKPLSPNSFTTSGELVHSVLREGNSSLTSSLEGLQIMGAEGMESWPDWLGPQLTSLRDLFIGCTPSLPFLPESMPNITSLRSLWIDSCPNLPESMANLTSLQRLVIYSCPNLPESKGISTSLRTLVIVSCPNLQILPEWVLRVNTTIQLLVIRGCPELTRRYNKETGEDRHQIAHIRDTHIDVRD